MSLTEIQTLLDAHRDEILVGTTKADKLERVIALLEKAYPDVPLSMAASDVTLMIAKQNHIETQNLIQALRYLQTAKGEIVVIPGDIEDNTNEVMKYIQRFIAV